MLKFKSDTTGPVYFVLDWQFLSTYWGTGGMTTIIDCEMCGPGVSKKMVDDNLHVYPLPHLSLLPSLLPLSILVSDSYIP